MLDKQLARKLAPLVNNPEVWEALKEHLNNLQTLELQVLVAATSEQEMYRSQGKLRFLAHLDSLKEQVKEAMERINV
jgi:hypothetical protein